MRDPLTTELEEALRRCDSEPVHIPGAIQPCGALLALDRSLKRVLKASANLEDYLGVAAGEALQQSPATLLGPRLMSRLTRTMADDSFSGVITQTLERPLANRKARLQLSAYHSGEHTVLEFEAMPGSARRRWLAAVNAWLARLAQAETQAELLDVLVRAVQDFTGHERVMVYQFDEQWHGAVVAECCKPGIGGFLGHRFPASDIPPQVRELYYANPVRSIPDATVAAVPLLPAEPPGGEHNLDLSRGLLRAVSPVHLRYLANMGVASSLSLAIYGQEILWGLVACHGTRPRNLPPPARDAALSLVRMATQRLFLLKARSDARFLKHVLNSRELLSEKRGRLVTPEQLVREHGDEWQGLFRACGVALVSREGITCHGRTPEQDVVRRMATRLTASHQQAGPWLSHQLPETVMAEAGDPAGCYGLLALPLDIDSPPGWLMLFREEQVVTHYWAGDARQPARLSEDSGRLTPRHSFDTWVEQVQGQSRHWQPTEVQAAADLAEDLAVAASVHRIALLNRRLEEVNEHLNELAQTDALTQIWNRYRMEQALETEFAAAQRHARPCSIILLDVDHFKRFNDQHGHQAGDQVLRTLAEELQHGLRRTDYLGRWGGEEFIVLAGNSRLEEAAQLAERLREHIAGLDLGPLGQLTFSAGVAEWQPGDSRRSLLERADKALYRAKHAGRNRVHLG